MSVTGRTEILQTRRDSTLHTDPEVLLTLCLCNPAAIPERPPACKKLYIAANDKQARPLRVPLIRAGFILFLPKRPGANHGTRFSRPYRDQNGAYLPDFMMGRVTLMTKFSKSSPTQQVRARDLKASRAIRNLLPEDAVRPIEASLDGNLICSHWTLPPTH